MLSSKVMILLDSDVMLTSCSLCSLPCLTKHFEQESIVNEVIYEVICQGQWFCAVVVCQVCHYFSHSEWLTTSFMYDEGARSVMPS